MAKCEVEHDHKKCWRRACYEHGTCVDKMAAEPAPVNLPSLVEELRAEVETLRRENQKLRAMLSDEKNGTPCAQIRWQQERDDLRRERDELLAALLEISQVACSLSPEQKIANSAIAKVKS